MRLMRALVVATIAGILAAGCGDRSVEREDVGERPAGVAQAASPVGRVALPRDLNLEVLWATPIEAGRVTSAITFEDLAIVTTQSAVTVIRARDGMVEWSQSLGRKKIFAEWAPVVTEEAVHVFAENAVARFDRIEGTRDWLLELPPYIVLSTRPAVVGETVYTPTWDGRLYALEVKEKNEIIPLGETGEVVEIPRRWFSKAWEQNLEDSVLAPVVARGGFLYAGTDGGLLVATPQIGPRAAFTRGSYRLDLGGRLRSALCLREDHIYAGSSNYSLYGVHRYTGDKLWEFFSGREILRRPLADEKSGLVYAVSEDVGLNAVSADKGVKAWSVPEGREIVGYGVEVVYVFDKAGALLALDKKTGKTRWRSSLSGMQLYPCQEQFEFGGKPLRLMAVNSANQAICLVEPGWRPPKVAAESKPDLIFAPKPAAGKAAPAPKEAPKP